MPTISPSLVFQFTLLLVVFFALQISAAVLVYFERKISGWAQQRVGPNRVGPLGQDLGRPAAGHRTDVAGQVGGPGTAGAAHRDDVQVIERAQHPGGAGRHPSRSDDGDTHVAPPHRFRATKCTVGYSFTNRTVTFPKRTV